MVPMNHIVDSPFLGVMQNFHPLEIEMQPLNSVNQIGDGRQLLIRQKEVVEVLPLKEWVRDYLVVRPVIGVLA
jgi:hypothetical protein